MCDTNGLTDGGESTLVEQIQQFLLDPQRGGWIVEGHGSDAYRGRAGRDELERVAARGDASHAEDRQVRHLSGQSEPPPGSFYRARRGISWRLPPGGEIEIPWRPPAGKRLLVKVRRDGPVGAYGYLVADWGSDTGRRIRINGRFWHSKMLPPPSSLGGGVLHLRWQVPSEQPDADVLVYLPIFDQWSQHQPAEAPHITNRVLKD